MQTEIARPINHAEVNLTPAQAAEMLNVPVTTLQAWRSTKRVRVPYFKLGGHVRYPLSQLVQFIALNSPVR